MRKLLDRTEKQRDPAPAGELLRYFYNVVMKCESNECLIWPYGTSDNGYARLSLNGKRPYVHRTACECRHGPAPSPDYEAAHTCGNGRSSCVNPNHLEWKTPSANQMDRVAHGTSNRGERQGRSKLTREAVSEIRALRGVTDNKELAEKFGVSERHIRAVQSGKTWRWFAASNVAQHIAGTLFFVIIVTASFGLSGCSTDYNTWSPREPGPVAERSCASGYYQCKSGSMDHDKDGLR